MFPVSANTTGLQVLQGCFKNGCWGLDNINSVQNAGKRQMWIKDIEPLGMTVFHKYSH